MATCNAKSSVPTNTNYWENLMCNKGYAAFYRFNKNQCYDGEFFRDSLHGQGAYTWQNKAVYEGGFYSNMKEGYASVSFTDNSYFEGLFVKNRPFGPGILTYSNGRQDAGFWMGSKLVRLSRAVDYIIPRLAPTSAAKIKLLQFKSLIPLNEEFFDSATVIMDKLRHPSPYFSTPYSSLMYDPRSMFFNKQLFEKAYFIRGLSDEFVKDENDILVRLSGDFKVVGEDDEEDESLKESRIPSHCQCQQNEYTINFDNIDEIDICEEECTKGELEMGILAYFTKFGDLEEHEEEVEESVVLQGSEDEAKSPKILLWNRSELCKEILKQMFRYRRFEEMLNFNLAKLMLGARTSFRNTGEKEKQCLHLLKMCSLGPPEAVKDLLCSYEISQDLMDGRGNNCLMFASATDQHEVIDILTDYGVDANSFNDEGLTPLNLCLLRRLALMNRISSWETAFLPEEIDRSLLPNDFPEEELKFFQSITSLDRIFGDGMSIYDSRTLLHDNRFLALLPTPSNQKNLNQSMSLTAKDFFESIDAFNFSQITILDLLRSPKNYSVPSIENQEHSRSLQKLDSFCSFQTTESSQKIGSDDPTPRIKFIPKTIKRDEYEKSLQKADRDKYLFAITFKKNPNLVEKTKKDRDGTGKSSKTKSSRKAEEEKKEQEQTITEDMELEFNRKLCEIDKTIEKLLKRGADPNISEVPKPSIHLAVHTKDLNLITCLLSYGASPDSQLYRNEGLLTPLHLIVLQEPDQRNVRICELLIRFDANPELETTPEFYMIEEEKTFLISEYGRTPLQLLCMRPDLEWIESNDILINIGLLLANASNKRHFYNGHSCLTLAMLTGNFKLLKALLECKFFNPNDILQNDRGTALHVLVSTELQRVTPYENSIKMCDLLIESGADPLIKFKHPKKLLGTCVDYGYREIEAEKEARKPSSTSKKDSKGSRAKEKTAARDYLKDHERVVEYLANIALNKAAETDLKVKKCKSKSDVDERSEKSSRKVGKKEKNKETCPTESVEAKEPSTIRSEVWSELEKLKNEPPCKKLRSESILKSEKTEKKKKNEECRKLKPQDVKENEKPLKEKNKTDTESADKLNSRNLQKGRLKTPCCTSQTGKLETFPEKLRQAFLRLYGTRFDIDTNELLVPYVVLRNGELYYKFHNHPKGRKEQYSLI